MRSLKLLLFGLFLTNLSFGQIVKLQTGTSLSSLDWRYFNSNEKLFNKTLIGYSILVGLDYFDKKYFNLSSNLGIIRKGGKDKFSYTDENGAILEAISKKVWLDYFTLNMTCELKYPFKQNFIPFISVGPRFDYLIGYESQFDGLIEIGALNKVNLGFILGGGMKYDFQKIQVGVRADYYQNLYSVAELQNQSGSNAGKIDDHTFSINVSLGYKLKS